MILLYSKPLSWSLKSFLFGLVFVVSGLSAANLKQILDEQRLLPLLHRFYFTKPDDAP